MWNRRRKLKYMKNVIREEFPWMWRHVYWFLIWIIWTSTILKMKSTRPSNTSESVGHITRRHIPENTFLHGHRHKNLKYHKFHQLYWLCFSEYCSVNSSRRLRCTFLMQWNLLAVGRSANFYMNRYWNFQLYKFLVRNYVRSTSIQQSTARAG